MKKIIALAFVSCTLLMASCVNAQDKSKRASPPAKVSQTINNGATITIDYSQPSLKGRTIGKDVEPMSGKVWRMGANEATIFEVNKDVTIEGKKLPAGKYSLFGLRDDEDFTLIFNKEWNISGTDYDDYKDKDALKIKVKSKKADNSLEKLTYIIDKNGKVALQWGTMLVNWNVK